MMYRSTKFQAPALWMREPHREKQQRAINPHATRVLTLRLPASESPEEESVPSNTVGGIAQQQAWRVPTSSTAVSVVVLRYQGFFRKMVAHHENHKPCNL